MRRGTRWLAVHAVLALALAAVCLLAPRLLLAETARLPFARFAAALLGAALVSLAVLWGAAARAGERSGVARALTVALVFDVQLPLVLALHPYALDAIDKRTPVPWFALPLALVFLLAAPTWRVRAGLRAGG